MMIGVFSAMVARSLEATTRLGHLAVSEKVIARKPQRGIGVTMSTETEKCFRVLCTISLHNNTRRQSIFAEIGEPISEVTHPPGAPEPVHDWGSSVVVNFDGNLHQKIVWSSNWQGSFLLALDYIRRLIPDGQEREWLDEEGVESWCILPKLVPISWGYDLYERISRISDQAEREFVEGIERRRLRSEGHSGQEDK